MVPLNHLIVGHGEVGQAIHEIIIRAYIVDHKVTTWEKEPVDVIHICIPYNEKFEETVKEYQKICPFIIVHSSVPVGTCDKLKVVHSPIRGVHPFLEEGIRTFVKYFGGRGAAEAASIFSRFGLRVKVYDSASITEAIKLWDTTQYGRLIMMEKEIYKWCEKHHLPFEEVYQEANKDYNAGYTALGRPEVVRPWLKHIEGKIGGHCVVNNSKLLGVKL